MLEAEFAISTIFIGNLDVVATKFYLTSKSAKSEPVACNTKCITAIRLTKKVSVEDFFFKFITANMHGKGAIHFNLLR